MENSIKYTLTIGDIKDYTKYQHKIPRVRKFMLKSQMKAYFVIFICMLVCFWAFIDGGQINWSSLSVPVMLLLLRYFVTSLLIVIAICLITWFISSRDLFGASSRIMLRYLEGRSLNFELKLLDEGIYSANGTSSGVITWNRIVDVYKSEKSIFIFKGRYDAIIVPKRAFNSDEEFNGFFDYIKTAAIS